MLLYKVIVYYQSLPTHTQSVSVISVYEHNYDFDGVVQDCNISLCQCDSNGRYYSFALVIYLIRLYIHIHYICIISAQLFRIDIYQML